MTGKPDPVDIFDFFFKWLNNIFVIKIFFSFLFMDIKCYEAFFDHFCQSPVAAKITFLTKNNILI